MPWKRFVKDYWSSRKIKIWPISKPKFRKKFKKIAICPKITWIGRILKIWRMWSRQKAKEKRKGSKLGWFRNQIEVLQLLMISRRGRLLSASLWNWLWQLKRLMRRQLVRKCVKKAFKTSWKMPIIAFWGWCWIKKSKKTKMKKANTTHIYNCCPKTWKTFQYSVQMKKNSFYRAPGSKVLWNRTGISASAIITRLSVKRSPNSKSSFRCKIS